MPMKKHPNDGCNSPLEAASTNKVPTIGVQEKIQLQVPMP
jgi:hypothetical protein